MLKLDSIKCSALRAWREHSVAENKTKKPDTNRNTMKTLRKRPNRKGNKLNYAEKYQKSLSIIKRRLHDKMNHSLYVWKQSVHIHVTNMINASDK